MLAAFAREAPLTEFYEPEPELIREQRRRLEALQVPNLFVWATAAQALMSNTDMVAVDMHSLTGATWPHNVPEPD